MTNPTKNILINLHNMNRRHNNSVAFLMRELGEGSTIENLLPCINTHDFLFN